MKSKFEVEDSKLIDIVEELKTDRDDLSSLEIALMSIFTFIVVALVVAFSFSKEFRDYVSYPLINQDELTIVNWIYITSFSILLGVIGFPLTIHNFMIASIMKDFLFALSISITANISASTFIFLIGRYFLAYRLKIAFKDNRFYQTLQYAVRKDPIKFTILFKLLLIPHVFKNYALAITDLEFKYFILATIISNTVLGTIWVVLGNSVREVVVATIEQKEKMRIILLTRIGLIILSVSVTFYLFYYARTIYIEMEEKKIKCSELKIAKENEENPSFIEDPILKKE